MKKRLILLAGLVPAFLSAQNMAMPVNVGTVTEGKIDTVRNFVGTVYFDRTAVVAGETAGLVKELAVNDGDRVRAGQVLAVLDDAILSASIDAAKANAEVTKARLAQAKTDLARYQKLLETKSVSVQSYDEAATAAATLESTLLAQQAQLKALEIEKAKKTVTAPFNGVVLERHTQKGQWLAAGGAVVTLADTDSAVVQVNLPLSYFGGLKKGAPLHMEAGGKDLEGSLSAVIPSADVTSRTFPVKVTPAAPAALIAGSDVKVSVPDGVMASSLLVPRDALIRRFNQQVIFIVADGTAQMLPVTVTGYEKDRVALTAPGLAAGAQVIVKGNERIFPGMPVAVLPSGSAQ